MYKLLDIDTSSFGGILQLIFGILCLPVLFYFFRLVFGYIFGGIAKVSNRQIVRHGRKVADPDTIEMLNEDVKHKALAIKQGVSQMTNFVKKQVTEQKGKDLSTKLAEVEQLKENGSISEQEYLDIRSEILKKHYS